MKYINIEKSIAFVFTLCFLSGVRFFGATASSLFLLFLGLIAWIRVFINYPIQRFRLPTILCFSISFIPLLQSFIQSPSPELLFFYGALFFIGTFFTILPLKSKPIFALSLSLVFYVLIWLPPLQILVQLYQFSASVLGFDSSFINSLFNASNNYEESVFVTNGLSMYRFSGIFNQPLESGIFWGLTFINSLLFQRLKALKLPYFNLPTIIIYLYLIFSLLGLLLCGSKLILIIIPVYIILNAQLLFRLIVRQKLNKYIFGYIIIYACLISLLNILASNYFQQFYSINPIYRFGSGTYDLSSIYNLTGGRLSSNGSESVIQFNFSGISILGNGYHTYTIDNGYYYLLTHIGLFGTLLMVLFILSVFIHPLLNPSYAQALIPFRFISIFYSLFLVLSLLGGSIFTIPKASSFIFLCMIFVYHVFTSLLITL